MKRPDAQPRPRVSHPTTILLRLSVTISFFGGFGLGLALLWGIALGDVSSLPFAALTQVHGQVQLIGFAGLFILGSAAQLLPGFLATPLVHRRWILTGGWLIALSLVARAVAQPVQPGLYRAAGLWFSGLAQAGGILLCLASYGQLVRRSIQPWELWRRLAVVGCALLVAGVLLNLLAMARLAAGESVVAAPLDLAINQLELSGFIVIFAFAMSRKVLPHLLLLRPPNDRLAGPGALLYLLGVLAITLASVLDMPGATPTPQAILLTTGNWLQWVGIVCWTGGLRLSEPPIRISAAPGITEPVRRWVRIAYAWCLIAVMLGTFGATRALVTGQAPDFFFQSASRHALGQGFILTIIVAFGARILPGFSTWAIQRPRLLEIVIAGIILGGVLRVGGELAVSQGYALGESLAGMGGLLAVLSFSVFAVALARQIGKSPAGAPARRKIP